MKIRTDYVSNSSSSSFVLGTHPVFKHFNITKQDILEALVELYGGQKVYEKAVKERKDAAKKEPQYYKEELKYNSFGPFYVYDLFDKKDRKEAIKRWGNLLEGWWASNCHIVRDDEEHEGEIQVGTEGFKCFSQAVEAIAELYDVSKYELMDYAKGTDPECEAPQRFVRTKEKDPKTGMYGHYADLDPEVLSMVRKICYQSGAVTNLGVLRCKMARFFVHADDNELCGPALGDDEKDKNGNAKWETESYTYDRLCEILYKHFVLKGKIVPDDPKFLEKMKCDPKYLTQREIANGEIYDFYNGTDFTWEDLKWNSMTWNMHEG